MVKWFNHAVSTLSLDGHCEGRQPTARSTRMRRSPVRNLPQSPLASTIRTRIRPRSSRTSHLTGQRMRSASPPTTAGSTAIPDGTFRPNQLYHPRRGDDACQPRTQASAGEQQRSARRHDQVAAIIPMLPQWYYLAVQEATNSHDTTRSRARRQVREVDQASAKLVTGPNWKSKYFPVRANESPGHWPGDFIALIVFSKGNKFQRIFLVKIITYCPLRFLYHRFIIEIAEKRKEK